MYERILANFAMHVSLDKNEAASITAALEYIKVKRNESLLAEGRICRNIYFVNKGCLRVFHTDKEGEEHNIIFCPGNWWGVDIASFSGQSPSFYAIAAVEESELFYLTYTTLERLYIEVPKLERFFRIMIQNGFNLYQQRITADLSLPAEERYRQFQELYPGLEQRIAQKHIAAYLGITPVFLSRIRRRNGPH